MLAIGRLFGRCIDVTSFVAGIAVILMMVQITVDVIGKYLYNIPIPATIAIVSNYYMVVVAFLPLALAERRHSHISVELVTDLLPQRAQRHLFSWTYLFSALAFAFLTYAGWREATTKHAISAFIIEHGQRIPTWPSYYLLPIGCGLMSVMLLYRFLAYLSGTKIGVLEENSLGDEFETHEPAEKLQ
jgi:TRAP-type C4-dicarboxylate transport system permease small subunit